MAEEQLNIVLVISVLRWSFVVRWSDISAKFWSDRLWIVPLSWGKSFIKDGDLFAPVLIANMLTMMITLITFSIFDSFFFFTKREKRRKYLMLFLREIFLKEILHVDSLSDWRGFTDAILFIFALFVNYDLFPTVGVRLCVKMARTLGSSDSRFFGFRFGVLVWRCWFSVFCWKESTVLSIFWSDTGWQVRPFDLLFLLPWIRPLSCQRLLCLSVSCFVYCPDVCLFATA